MVSTVFLRVFFAGLLLSSAISQDIGPDEEFETSPEVEVIQSEIEDVNSEIISVLNEENSASNETESAQEQEAPIQSEPSEVLNEAIPEPVISSKESAQSESIEQAPKEDENPSPQVENPETESVEQLMVENENSTSSEKSAESEIIDQTPFSSNETAQEKSPDQASTENGSSSSENLNDVQEINNSSKENSTEISTPNIYLPKDRPTLSDQGPRFLNGVDANHTSYHLRLIVKTDIRTWFCAGSLIHPRFVLTAAHCIADDEFNQIISIRICGGSTSCGSTEEKGECVEVGRDARIVHESYSSLESNTLFGNDIALIKLPIGAFLYNELIDLVGLPDDCIPCDYYIGLCGKVTSCGLTNNCGNTDKVLQETTECIVPTEEGLVWKKVVLPHGFYYTRGIVRDGKGSSNCNSESGGPFVIPNPDPNSCHKFIQVGLVSFGTVPCAFDIVNGATSVCHYLRWIHGAIKLELGQEERHRQLKETANY